MNESGQRNNSVAGGGAPEVKGVRPPVAVADAARPVACLGCDEMEAYRDFKAEMEGCGWTQADIEETWDEMDHQDRVHHVGAAAPVAAPPRWCPDCEETVDAAHCIAPVPTPRHPGTKLYVSPAPAHEAVPPASVALLRDAREALYATRWDAWGDKELRDYLTPIVAKLDAALLAHKEPT